MVQRVDKAFVLQPNEGTAIDLGGFAVSVKATTEETDGAFSLLEADERPGFGPPLHIHHNAAEAFYVLAGEYTIYLGERALACPAGSFIYIPAGMRHGFKVGSVPSRKLNLYSPATMIGYFEELSAAIKSGDVDDARLSGIALKYGMEVVGPVPESYV
jgi:mannose-6-phosphate isomerase-like protein (cupin superfamily)